MTSRPNVRCFPVSAQSAASAAQRQYTCNELIIQRRTRQTAGRRCCCGWSTSVALSAALPARLAAAGGARPARLSRCDRPAHRSRRPRDIERNTRAAAGAADCSRASKDRAPAGEAARRTPRTAFSETAGRGRSAHRLACRGGARGRRAVGIGQAGGDVKGAARGDRPVQRATRIGLRVPARAPSARVGRATARRGVLAGYGTRGRLHRSNGTWAIHGRLRSPEQLWRCRQSSRIASQSPVQGSSSFAARPATAPSTRCSSAG